MAISIWQGSSKDKGASPASTATGAIASAPKDPCTVATEALARSGRVSDYPAIIRGCASPYEYRRTLDAVSKYITLDYAGVAGEGVDGMCNPDYGIEPTSGFCGPYVECWNAHVPVGSGVDVSSALAIEDACSWAKE